MGTTSDKLIYLNDTKVGIADAIETNNVIVHDEDTFRSYVEKIVSIKPTFVYDTIERISQKGARFEAIDCLDYSVKNNMYGNPSFVLKPHIYSSRGLYPIIPENRIGQEEILNGDFEQEGTEQVLNGDFEELGAEEVVNGDFEELGVQQLPNNTFDNDLTGWLTSEDAVWESGFNGRTGVVYQPNGGANKGINLANSGLIENKFYKVSFDIYIVSGSVYYGRSDNKQVIETTTGQWVTVTNFFTATGFIDNWGVRSNENGSEWYLDKITLERVGQNWTVEVSNVIYTTVGNGVARFDGLGTNTYAPLRQGIPSVEVGKQYEFSIEVKNHVLGDININLWDTSDTSGQAQLTVTGDGIYKGILTATGTQLEIVRRFTTGTYEFEVDNVTIKKVDPNDTWTKGDGWSIENGVAICDGTQTNFESLQQFNVTEVGKFYKVTFDLNLTSGILETKGSSTYNAYYPEDNGTVVEYIQADNTQYRFTSFPSNTTGSIDNVSVKEVGQGWEFGPVPENLTFKFENGAVKWPTSDSIYNNSAIFQQNLIVGKKYKCSLDYLSGSGGVRFYEGTYGNGVNFDFPGSYTFYFEAVNAGRLSILPNPNAIDLVLDNISVKEVIEDNSSKFTVLRDNIVSRTNSKGESEDVQIDTPVIDFIGDCPALNLGSGLNPDYITGGGSEDAINSEEGLFYVDAQALSNDLTWRQFSLSDGTTSNRVNIRYTDVSNTIAAGLWMGGSTIAEITYQLPDITKRTKIAFSYKDNEFRLWVNGAVVGEILSGTTLPVDTLNNIEFAKGDGDADPMVAYTYDLQVFNEFKEFKEIEKITGFNTFEEVANFLEYTII